MNMDRIEKKLFDEISFIKKQLGEIKEHMVDIDSLLTAEEKELVFRSFENEARGKLVPLKKLEESNSKMFEVFLDIPVQDFLEEAGESINSQVKETLEELVLDPVPHRAKRVIESPQKLFRLRPGHLRFLYRVDYEKRTLVVITIEPLSRIYR